MYHFSLATKAQVTTIFDWEKETVHNSDAILHPVW